MPNDFAYIFRILISVICGMAIGYEREKKSKGAGIRTHTIVALSSSLMMIVSKYGFMDVIAYNGVSFDASRIAAGVVSAVGFLGAGIIFVRQESVVIGITTAAGLWATVGIGIAIGAGMYGVGIASAIMLIIVQLILHSKLFVINRSKNGSLTIIISNSEFKDEMANVLELLAAKKIRVRHLKITRQDELCKVIVQVIFPRDFKIQDFYADCSELCHLESIHTEL